MKETKLQYITKIVPRYKTHKKTLKQVITAFNKLQEYTRNMGPKTSIRTCPICKNKKYKFAFHAVTYDFVECEKCNFFYVRKLFDEETLNKFYRDDIHNKELQQIQYNTVKEQIDTRRSVPDDFIKRCIQYQTGKGKCLDIGCGFGVNMSFLAPHFESVEGVELDEFAVSMNRKMFKFKIHTKELKDLKLKNNSYDMIILNQVIEHISDLDMFHQVFDLLRPGGILGVATPTADSISFGIFKGDWVHVFEIGHIQLFNTNSFNAFAKQFGFRIGSMQTNNWLDIQLNDLICKNRKDFIHRFNDVPFINPINLGLTMATKFILNKTQLLTKLNKGCYVEVIMRKPLEVKQK